MLDYITSKMSEIPYSYHMLINEEDAKLYIDKECQQEIGDLSDLNYKMIKVVTQHQVDGELTVLLEQKGELIGWFRPIQSIMLYHKAFEHVIVDLPNFKSPAINRLMKNGADLTLAFKTYQLTSRYFTIYDGQQIEALYTGNRFLGFAPSSTLSRSVKIPNEETRLNLTMFKTYASAKRDETLDIQFDAEQPVRALEIFPHHHIVKIKQGALTAWVDKEALQKLDFHAAEKKWTTEEMMIEHIVQTYMTERKNHQTIIKKMVNESMSLRNQVVKLSQRKARTEQLYENLKQSKLGKIQVAIWERRARGGRRK